MAKAARARPPSLHSIEKKVTQVKQYLVAKMIGGLKNHNIALVPLPGLYSLGAAQDVVTKAKASEPEAEYVIQEVGAA
jgi:hypothetical protein